MRGSGVYGHLKGHGRIVLVDTGADTEVTMQAEGLFDLAG